MSFRTERQRSEESLRPHSDKGAALEKRRLLFRTAVDAFASGRRLFLHGSRDSSLRWRSVRNDIVGGGRPIHDWHFILSGWRAVTGLFPQSSSAVIVAGEND